MTFRREVVVKRLKEAKKTAESVQSISKLIIHYHEHVAVSSETWLEVFQQGMLILLIKEIICFVILVAFFKQFFLNFSVNRVTACFVVCCK